MSELSRKELIEGYLRVPTANVCDAMAQLDLPVRVIEGLHPVSPTQRPAVGFAVTVKQMQRHQAAEGKGLATHSKVIDTQLQYGDMLVIDVGGRTDVCTGGALLARRAQQRGASGYLINGCLRDVREIAALDFPVHLVGASPVKSSPALQTVGINIPVEINGVQILPGDLVMSDDTGVIVVPAQVAEQVLERALAINAKEAALEEMLIVGKTFAEAAAAVKL